MKTYHSRPETPILLKKDIYLRSLLTKHRTLSNSGFHAPYAKRQDQRLSLMVKDYQIFYCPSDYLSWSKIIKYLIAPQTCDYSISWTIVSIPHATSFARRITATLIFIH